MADPPRLVFGLVPPPSFTGSDARVGSLLRAVSERAEVMLVQRHVDSYDHLAALVASGDLDVAWLPPILFARLQADGIVRALVVGERAGRETYCSVLVARADSGIGTYTDLRGKRAGWVDPLSATGYVMPRIRLAAAGFDPTTMFASERFFGSHAAVVRAVIDGAVDVGATFAGFGDRGEIVRGGLVDAGEGAEDLLVVASFSDIPPDVVAVHARVAADVGARVAAALEGAEGESLDAVRAIFGVLRLARSAATGHEQLRAELEDGVDSGVIPAAAAFLSTRPPRA